MVFEGPGISTATEPTSNKSAGLYEKQIFTISQDGALFQWLYSQNPLSNGDLGTFSDNDSPDRWRITQRHYFMQNNAKMTCAAYHPASNLLVSGFSNGLFGLCELPEFNMLHTLR